MLVRVKSENHDYVPLYKTLEALERESNGIAFDKKTKTIRLHKNTILY